MQLNKVFKGMVIALPVVTLMACSSSSQVEDQASTNQTQASQEADQGSNVQTQPMEKMKSPEEIKREKLEALKNEQVVHFEFDRSTIQPDYYSILNKHAEFLVNNPEETVTIEGHCDQRGTPEYNIALGERRAKSISTYLQNAGVSASQISIVSYGEEKPVNTAQTQAAFAENRRGVLVY
ncbi:Peptidoglycan-associated lipoprotein [Saliniradius amylolyticus]|uniref:Peptidoglycan-associated lipoprotein n=1 Tax=Saliniradius amylolyticus TaxID=2183582 RepID=A0A2S2E3T7_9ALTE|nr:peptidoglycan-associated lipoprotein Pal [Saliniradius amylolyticus]AWL12318.1 Peptidoglycan-associated lipoprotein [Saliniradius amylolyticus]